MEEEAAAVIQAEPKQPDVAVAVVNHFGCWKRQRPAEEKESRRDGWDMCPEGPAGACNPGSDTARHVGRAMMCPCWAGWSVVLLENRVSG